MATRKTPEVAQRRRREAYEEVRRIGDRALELLSLLEMRYGGDVDFMRKNVEPLNRDVRSMLDLALDMTGSVMTKNKRAIEIARRAYGNVVFVCDMVGFAPRGFGFAFEDDD
jgi:hypothetical protein